MTDLSNISDEDKKLISRKAPAIYTLLYTNDSDPLTNVSNVYKNANNDMEKVQKENNEARDQLSKSIDKDNRYIGIKRFFQKLFRREPSPYIDKEEQLKNFDNKLKSNFQTTYQSHHDSLLREIGREYREIRGHLSEGSYDPVLTTIFQKTGYKENPTNENMPMQVMGKINMHLVYDIKALEKEKNLNPGQSLQFSVKKIEDYDKYSPPSIGPIEKNNKLEKALDNISEKVSKAINDTKKGNNENLYPIRLAHAREKER